MDVLLTKEQKALRKALRTMAEEDRGAPEALFRKISEKFALRSFSAMDNAILFEELGRIHFQSGIERAESEAADPGERRLRRAAVCLGDASSVLEASSKAENHSLVEDTRIGPLPKTGDARQTIVEGYTELETARLILYREACRLNSGSGDDADVCRIEKTALDLRLRVRARLDPKCSSGRSKSSA
jgi:hypothetical protein